MGMDVHVWFKTVQPVNPNQTGPGEDGLLRFCPVSGLKFEPTFVGTDWVQHALKTVKPAKPVPIRAWAPHSIAAVGTLHRTRV